MYGKIGCRAHDYGKHNIRDLADKIKADGYQTMQLALKKALVDVEDLKDFLTKEKAMALAKCISEANLEVCVLGAYLNYAGLNDAKRDDQLDILKGHLKIAKTLGCRMVGTETGSLDEEYKEHPENHGPLAFERFKAAILEVLPLAEREDTYLAVEAVSHHIIHTPERMYQLLEAVQSDRLKVIFDISNLMTLENYNQQDVIMRRMFELMEEQILVVHVKDFDFVDNKKIILPLGEGKLNIELLMALVKKSPVRVDVLLEDVPKEALRASYIKLNEYIK